MISQGRLNKQFFCSFNLPFIKSNEINDCCLSIKKCILDYVCSMDMSMSDYHRIQKVRTELFLNTIISYLLEINRNSQCGLATSLYM